MERSSTTTVPANVIPGLRGEPPTRETSVAERPLLRPAIAERLIEHVKLAGFADAADSLATRARKHAEYLTRCVREAEAVLRGDLSAGTRLWLLLNEPVKSGPSLPASVLQQIGGVRLEDAPRVIDGDVLLRLIAGVVRAANQPAEAEAMLAALGNLLHPFFLLELAGTATERASEGDPRGLKTLVTAVSSHEWRDALAPQTRGGPAPKPIVSDRVPFDAPSWTHDHSSSAIDRWDFKWPCAGGTHKAMSQIDRFGGRYTIDSISDPAACPGQTITIRGHNFGPTGRVTFPFPDVTDPAFNLGIGAGMLVGVEPLRWTDTEIDVVVPPWATSGALQLDAYTRHVDICMTVDVYRLGNNVVFQGGLATVYQVFLRGVEVDLTEPSRPNLAPGDSVVVSYRASSGPSVSVKIQLMDGTKVLWERAGLPGGFGAVVLTVPDPEPHVPRDAVLVFTASSTCGSTQGLKVPVFLSVPPKLTIQYVEVTQGVQGDLGDVLAGRGMPTIAYKDTAVRVHMNCDRGGWFGNKLDKITGSLRVDGKLLSPTNVRGVVPDRGYAGINGLSNPQFTNDTLNFTIPAAWLTPGLHTLTVKLVCNDPSGRIEIAQNVTWGWVAKNPYRVRAVYMALYGDKDAMLDYVRSVLDYLPTPLSDVGIAAPVWITHTYNLRTRSGWEDLLSDLEDAWDDADEESGVRWLGIVPASERFAGMPLSLQGIAGTPGIAALAMGDRPEIGAHELGHTYGLHHINLPVGGPDGPYDPAADGGLLRRPPFDVRSSTAIPLPAGELMTYFQPIRPGTDTWMRLFLNT